MNSVLVNGRHYLKPRSPTAVICVDGWDPAYLRAGLAGGHLNCIASFHAHGYVALASAVMPTFTNPNNASIVTGVAPSEHGIQGNYFYDRDTGREVMLNDASFLRVPTILAALGRAGVRVAVVTAKDKLKSIISAGLEGIALSAEHPASTSISDLQLRAKIDSMPKPDRYSAELSYYALDAGVHILRANAADLVYISLSDYIQHKCAPGHPDADAFFRKLDSVIEELTHRGVTVGITADHGMSDKCAPNGAPNALYLEDELSERFGDGQFKVICPITDPYVRHHGALGSFARVYALTGDANPEAARHALLALNGVKTVLDRRSAADDLDLPFDLEADLAVVAASDFVLGSCRRNHDLSAIGDARLRSHGGASELVVPFVINAPVSAEYTLRATRRGLRNYDIFDYVLNGIGLEDAR